ncbi:type II secretion system protein [Shewanella sp.]|uniref:type II secretion system protein n=1 Tax=Shewanella sp. TaxID=50422 RepID=UPI0025F3F8B3|nr:type II secretion system protein [Shewanella sp.]
MNASNRIKLNAGFTLIELVVVIIILGILSVVAAPKFINLKSDAHLSVLRGLQGAISSGNALAYSKALIQGKETQAVANVDLGAAEVILAYGYIPTSLNGVPQGAKKIDTESNIIFNSITSVLDIDAAHLIDSSEVVRGDWGVMTHGIDMYVSFVPKGLSVDSLCMLEYTGVNAAGEHPMFTIIDSGC